MLEFQPRSKYSDRTLAAQGRVTLLTLAVAALMAVTGPLEARISIGDISNRVGDLEKEDKDAVEQLIVDSVTLAGTGACATANIAGVNFDNGADPPNVYDERLYVSID